MKALTKNLYILILLLLTVNTASAQNLTPEQNEVWAIVQNYWEGWVSGDMETFKGIFDDSYIASSHSAKFPQTKASILKWIEEDISNNKAVFYTISPLKIWVRGEFAFVNYSYSQIQRNKITFIDQTKNGTITDRLVKKEGKWFLVGDHVSSIAKN